MKFEKPEKEVPAKAEIQAQATVAQTTSFEVCIKAAGLPSRGLAYPAQADIRYRGYTFGEVKSIAQSQLGPNAIYERVLVGITTSFPKGELTLNDMLYLGLLRKISSLGKTQAGAQYQCKMCGKVNTHLINTDQLEFEDMKAPELPIVAEISGVEMQFRPVTVAQYLDLIVKGKDEDEVSVFASQCSNLPFDEAYERIYNANLDDSEVLKLVDLNLYHGLKTVRAKCECGWESALSLDSADQLIVPFRIDQGSIESRVRFGVPNVH